MPKTYDYTGEALRGANGGRRNDDHLISRCAADIEPEPVQWLWRGRIAIGKQTLIAGEPGLGKSQVALSLAAAVTTGGVLPCGEDRAPLGNVVIFSAEDASEDTIVPRLMAAGADRNRAHIVSAVLQVDDKGLRTFNLQTDLALLERKIAEIGDVVLVIFDPISSYFGPKIDSHANTAVRSVLEPLSEMAARYQAAFVSITHPPKGAGTRAVNRFIGSVAFIAAARAAFMVTHDAENETRRLFLPVKNNLAPLGKGLAFRLEQRIVGDPGKGVVASSVAWEPEPVTMSADEALRAMEDDGGDRKASREAEDFLRDRLADGAVVPAKEAEEYAREQLCIAPRTLDRARKKLGIIAEKAGLKDGWTWRLPPEGRQESPKDAIQNIGVLRDNMASFKERQQTVASFEERQKSRRTPNNMMASFGDNVASFGATSADAEGGKKETGAAAAPPKAASASDPWKDLDIPACLDRRQPQPSEEPSTRAINTPELEPVDEPPEECCALCGDPGDALRSPLVMDRRKRLLCRACHDEAALANN